MPRPLNLPEWAIAAAAGDVIDPGTARKQSGWKLVGGVPEKPSYQTFNWYQQTVYRWLEYFSELTDAELTQLKNIDSVEISNAQWAYLAGLANVIRNGDATSTVGSVVTSSVGPASGNLNVGTDADTIVIGKSTSIVTVNGSVINVTATNSQITDKLVRLNVGGGEFSADDVGIEVEENGAVVGSIKTALDGQVWSVKAPARPGQIWLEPNGVGNTHLVSSATGTRTQVYPDKDGTFAMTSDLSAVGDVKQGGNSFNAAMTIGTNDNFVLNLETAGVAKWQIGTSNSELIGLTSILNIYPSTVDGSDTGVTAINGGGASGTNRGAVVQVSGNERATIGGQVRIFQGETPNARTIFYFGASTFGGQMDNLGAWMFGPAVSGNPNGQKHIINGGLWAGNVTAAAYSGSFAIGTNTYQNSGAATNNRTDTTTGGMSLIMHNRLNAGHTAFTVYTNNPGDSLTTPATATLTSSHSGVWVIGPTAKLTSSHHTIYGSVVSNANSINAGCFSSDGEVNLAANLYRDTVGWKACTTTTGWSLLHMPKPTTATQAAFIFYANSTDAQTADASYVATNQRELMRGTADGSITLGPAPAAGTGVSHAFNLPTTGGYDLTTMSSGQIRFCNTSGSHPQPTIVSKSTSTATSGLMILSMTPTASTAPDMVFDVRTDTSTDPGASGNLAFRFQRYGVSLLDINRDGRTTIRSTNSVRPLTVNNMGVASTAVNVQQIDIQQAGISCGGIESDAAGGIQFYSPSDERLKENIVDYNEDCLSKIMSVRLREFNWKHNGVRSVGPIAQEIAEVYPSHVSTGPDGYLTVAKGFDWEFIRAFQQLKAQLDETRAQLAELKARIS